MNSYHDKFIKERLSVKQNAIDFLKISISPDQLDLLDLDTIVHVKNSFVNKSMFKLLSFGSKWQILF